MTPTDASARARRRAKRAALRRAPDRPIRVVVVDDCELVRHGLRDLLHDAGGFEIVGEAGSVDAAMATVAASAPDLVVLDIRLPDGNGLAVCRALPRSEPEAVCVVLTAFDEHLVCLEAARAGAVGVISKGEPEEELVTALRRAAAGESLLDADDVERSARGRQPEVPSALADLSSQHRRVVELLGEGLTNRQIGDRMHLAEKTIKNYVSNILTSLGMERRTEVAALAARLDERKRASSARLAG
ncbi:MAG: response regulator transcription factor [Actinomycetota bacterium]